MRSMKKTNEGVGEEVDANSTSHGAGQDSAEHVKRDQPNVAANISIFDDKEFTTTDECVQYMAETFGFSIPDVEFLVDLEGLLVYLSAKVKREGYCLYCQQAFTPGKPCQDHMVSASHCKLRFEIGIDREEYEKFYKFADNGDGGVEEDVVDGRTQHKRKPNADPHVKDALQQEGMEASAVI